ncbi:MAG: hypothetical protein AB1696_10710 [Planctomycetota bacterium]
MNRQPGEKMRAVHQTVFCLLLAVVLLRGGAAHADPSDALKPLLIALPGWESDEVEVLGVKTGVIRTTALQRAYYQGDAEATALLIATSRTTIDRKTADLRAECKGDKASDAKIDGFQVHVFYNTADRIGVVVVILNQGPSRAAMFSLNFDGIDEVQALDLAKKFDWKKMQAETVKL